MARAGAAGPGGPGLSPYDRLLTWTSEVGCGSWAQWRTACAHLDIEPTEAARNLSALGHVELDWADDRFACAPVTAALIPRSSGSVIVTGARPRGLRARLVELCRDERFDVTFHEPVAQLHGPETWLIEAELGDLEAFCEAAGTALEMDPGRRIVEWAPTCTVDDATESNEPRDYFPRVWVDPTTRQRRYDIHADREGLWLVRERRRDVAFLLHAGRWYRVPVREHGIYLAYPDRAFLAYDRRRQRLLVDEAALLPPLLARGATLQSGRLPLRENGRLVYVNVSVELAELIAGRLDARMEVRG